MKTIQRLCVLLVVLYAGFHAFEFLTTWYMPGPKDTSRIADSPPVEFSAAPSRERPARIVVGDPNGGPDRVIWSREE